MPAKKSSSSSFTVTIIVFVSLLLLLCAAALFFAKQRQGTFTTKNGLKTGIKVVLSPTPTPIVLRPDDGVKGTYAISQGKHSGPNITQMVFDPLDVKKGQTLTITVKVKHTSPVQTVTGTLQTDNGAMQMTFSRINGTDMEGSWQGSVKLTDSVNYQYVMRVSATAADGTNTVNTAPRAR